MSTTVDRLASRIRELCDDSFQKSSELDWCESCLEALDVVVTCIEMRREELWLDKLRVEEQGILDKEGYDEHEEDEP